MMEEGYSNNPKSEPKRTCPFEHASWLSKVTLWWMNPLFAKGRRTCLTHDDIYDVVSTDKASVVESRLERTWNNELTSARQEKRSPSFFKALFVTFRNECLLNGIFILISECIGVLRPYLLGKLLKYFEPNSDMSQTEVYVFAAILAVNELIRMITHPWYIFRSQCIDLRMKAAVSSLVYRKILKVNSLSLQKTTSGKIVNHLSTDVEKLTRTAEIVHYIWIAPVLLAISVYLIYQNVGIATVFMLPVLVALIPLEGLFGRLMGRLRIKVGAKTDKRVNIMNEIIMGMKVIKMYCWEKPFSRVISQLRRVEIKQIWIASILKCLNISIFQSSSHILCMAVFVAAWQLNVPLSSSIIFSVRCWIDSIKYIVIFCIGLLMERIFQVWASMKRIQSFLEEIELQDQNNKNVNSNQLSTSNKSPYCAVDICKMSAVWTNYIQSSPNTERNERNGQQNMAIREEEMVHEFSLKDIDLKITKGELIAVVGTVGSGKSSLLMTLLGELPATEGHIAVNGTIGYVSQQPWVVSGTVRNNILFGHKFDPGRYSDVVNVCALEKDIDLMSHGDVTLVGERGLLLSGGQKARLTLARTVYTDCDIYLLDDPLGAVDTEVGKHIFNKCICEYLAGKTRILVTHQLQYLKAVDKIVVFKKGRIVNVGKYEELQNNSTELSAIIKGDSNDQENDIVDENIKNIQAKQKTEESGERIEKEDMQMDTVGWRVYRDFIAFGYPLLTLPMILVLILLTQGSFVIGDWYLARWGDLQDALYSGGSILLPSSSRPQYTKNLSDTDCVPFMNISNTLQTTQQTLLQNLSSFTDVSTGDTLVHIYIVSIIVYIIFIVLLAVVVFTTLHIAGAHLHNEMFVKVINAKTRFFDYYPVGRILNRFARDLGIMDDVIPHYTYLVLEIGSRVIVSIVVTCVINPLLLVPLLPIIVFIVLLWQYATRTIRHLKRIEAVTRSPVFSHVSDTLQGLQTIRAMNKNDDFIKAFDRYQDHHTTASFLYTSSFRWLTIRSFGALGFYSLFVIFISLILKDVFEITGGLYGLTLSYVLMLTRPLEIVMRCSAQLESDMTSVERITAYTKLEQEAEKTSNQPPPTPWPEEGQITFRNLCLRYSESSPFVLLTFNFTIKGKEKVGIVGRTGAGKSSIIAALLRLAEPTGSITIDNVDIQTIGLHELRAKISVIPQDPILFGGTLRYNLDPFEEYDDGRLWDSLEQVQLKTKVEGMTGQLYAEMSEGGRNFSVGQRQLVCLARAVLHSNKILVLDEATANVDVETDEMIQRTISEKFKDCTVLTIAHRLHTIMDSDRVMVLDNGLLKEFDVPYKLLQYTNRYFRKLVDQSIQVELLESLAENSYKHMLINNTHL